MSEIVVQAGTNITALVKVANPGDVFLLEDGIYPALAPYNAYKDGKGVTIRALNKWGAVLQGVNLNKCGGIHIEDVKLVPSEGSTLKAVYVATGLGPFSVVGCEVSGPINVERPGDNGLTGISIQGATNVRIADNFLHDLYMGIGHLFNTDVEIKGNRLEKLRLDGIRGQGDNILIEDNLGTDFFYQEGDHADFIQFWTTSRTSGVSNVIIRNNHWHIGKGKPVQVIFMGNERRLPYKNVLIEGNSGFGGNWHGITLNMGEDVTIQNNFMQTQLGTLDSFGKQMTSKITLTDSIRSVVRDNLANKIVSSKNAEDVIFQDNDTIPLAEPGDDILLQGWLDAKLPEAQLLEEARRRIKELELALSEEELDDLSREAALAAAQEELKATKDLLTNTQASEAALNAALAEIREVVSRF